MENIFTLELEELPKVFKFHYLIKRFVLKKRKRNQEKIDEMNSICLQTASN